MSRPLVSVIIPVYDGERYLAEAIESVRDQTYRPLEIIVVDDGSTDASGDVAQSFSDVRYLAQENQGQATARNNGVAAARGEFLAFLDADDRWPSVKIERQMAAFDQDSTLSMVFGYAEQFYDPVARGSSQTNQPELPTLPAHVPSAMLVRASAFRTVGGFDSQWTVGEVVDWYARATDLGFRERMLDSVVLERRIHDGNLGTRHRATAARDYLSIVKQALDRRRARKAEP